MTLIRVKYFKRVEDINNHYEYTVFFTNWCQRFDGVIHPLQDIIDKINKRSLSIVKNNKDNSPEKLI